MPSLQSLPFPPRKVTSRYHFLNGGRFKLWWSEGTEQLRGVWIKCVTGITAHRNWTMDQAKVTMLCSELHCVMGSFYLWPELEVQAINMPNAWLKEPFGMKIYISTSLGLQASPGLCGGTLNRPPPCKNFVLSRSFHCFYSWCSLWLFTLF